MIFSYATPSRGRSTKIGLMALGIAVLPLAIPHEAAKTKPTAVARPMAPLPADPRVSRLHGFMNQLRCPVADLSRDFVRTADANGLDWRLLPSIAIIESGGGKAYKNNNIFGWNGGEQAFASIQSGMELVAYNLGHSPLYRNHGNWGKLRIYNEHEEYPGAVISVMNRISPSARLRPVRQILVRPTFAPQGILTQN